VRTERPSWPAPRDPRRPPVTRDELVSRTRQWVAEGDRLQAQPSMASLRTWLQLSDDLLSTAWGSMDRYHLVWLGVGRPRDQVRGRPMTPDEEDAYVREVAEQKTAALRMSLKAAEDAMPFVGETT
jgi:hypothetical protein